MGYYTIKPNGRVGGGRGGIVSTDCERPGATFGKVDCGASIFPYCSAIVVNLPCVLYRAVLFFYCFCCSTSHFILEIRLHTTVSQYIEKGIVSQPYR